MKSVKCIITACLTLTMVFQMLAPTTVALAEEINAVSGIVAQQADDVENVDTINGDTSAGTGSDESGSGDASASESGTASGSASSGSTAGEGATAGQGSAGANEDTSDKEDAQDVPATVAAGATITTVAQLQTAMTGHGEVEAQGETVTRITFRDPTALCIISNTSPSLYQTATIAVENQTGGAFDVSTSQGGYAFLGLGSDDYPFTGTFDAKSPSGSVCSIALATSLFNNVELNKNSFLPYFVWKGEGSEPVVAAKVSGTKTLDVTVQIADPANATVSESTAGITSALFGTVTGSLTLSVTYSFSGTRKGLGVTADATGNVGMLANTVESGTFTVQSVTLPNNVASGGTVKTNGGNAGLLVGEAKDGASLSVGTLSNVPTATVQSGNGCAGGVVGKVGSSTGATVEVTSEINLSSLTVKGTTAAGGFIGQATKLTLNQNKGAKVTCPRNVGDVNSANVGGFIGEVSFGSSVEFTNNDQIDTGNNGVTLAGQYDESKGVGSAIGKLNFADSTTAVSFKGGTFKSTYGNGGGAAVFGGLVGSVTGCTNSKPLCIEDVSTEFALEAAPQFTGGLVGWLGRGTGAVLEVKNASVKCTKLVQSGKGFGGVAGCIDNKSIADINGVTVQNEGAIENGAGIAAESWGSAIRLGGVTDFSGMQFAPDNSFTAKKVVSQIANVRSDNPTLVFARGTGSDSVPADADNADYWVYKRCAEVKIDDLGGAQDSNWAYGEVIRLDGTTLQKDLIKINADTHLLEGPSTTDWSWQVGSSEGKWSEGNRTLNIKSTQDFVCLALSAQFANLWNGVYGFNASDGSSLLGSDVTINLNADVNLSGTGVGGLGFDSANRLQTFAGTFKGNENKITLAIGEPYGKRGDNTIESTSDASAGNGKLYRHGRLGLFAAIGGGATVNNLTVDGAMKFDNGLGVDAGSLAATITGDATLSGVTCNPTITCDDSFGNDVNIGGIAGSVTGGGIVTFDSSNMSGSTKAQATINTGTALNGNTRIGGAVGYVVDVAATVNVASLEVGEMITANDSASNKIAQIGGLIGCIAQSTYTEGKIASSAEKNVNITGLTFDSFSMTVGKSGDKLNGAGGLLGYSWGNAVVTIGDSSINKDANSYALKTANASVTADNSKELGGLVYAASGHWIINDYALDLSGTTIKAESATTLGVLVGRGSKVKTTGVYGSESYTGLYLEDRAYWETAYKVSGITINAPKVSVFDEWVGNGVKPDSKLMDGEWNTVVSLHTQADTLDMSGNAGNDNSYKNRSKFGKDHNTNQSVRYYYNLDRAYSDMKSNGKDYTVAPVHLTTPQELLLWSACRYAPADIQKYVAPGMTGAGVGLNSYQVYIDGGKSPDQNTINLSGYSYYPAQPGGNVYVQNVNIRFCYSNIRSEYTNNKSNSAGTQHENMHCGFLRTMSANLTVSNVTLGGTIGIAVNDGDKSSGGTVSGALVCRYIYGSSASVKQISINGLTLDGLTVDGVTDATTYAPLLINEMQTYVNLNAKNISTTGSGYANGAKAATSLFGKLGVGSAADQVTATFSLINLPSATDNTIFTRASLLESFGYGEGKTGSAVYTFVEADQNADQSKNKVTFGSEIDANGENNEYVGKQLWYYDENTYETKDGLVTVDGKTANAVTPQFGGYLPYVKKGKANENNVQYHEIKVNQRVPKLATGCGTYGDPYAITKASELNAVADYINTRSAVDGWEVTITTDQSELCQRRNGGSTDKEITYVYKQANASSKKWEKKNGDTTDSETTLDEDTMHTYLQSAYYSVEPTSDNNNTIELDAASFQGLGNKSNPFRGVIVGDLGGKQATISINNDTGSLMGLIPYSYGSVVKNLNVVYQSGISAIRYSEKDSSGVPGSFFGGVIGCIMGGDNVIDGVAVLALSLIHI